MNEIDSNGMDPFRKALEEIEKEFRKESHPKIISSYFPKEHKRRRESDQETFIDICKNLIKFLPVEFPIINKNSKKKSLIVETRVLPHTEFVIKNTIQKLGDGWGHIIYCHVNNYNQIRSICDAISSEIEIRLLEKELTRNSYNTLLLDINFWNQINCEKVLVYQTDTFISKKFDRSFLDYDYAGGYWGTGHSFLIEKNYGEKEILIGNGGLSLRCVNKTKQILKNKKPVENKEPNQNLDLIPEDLFFSMEFKKNEFKFPLPQKSIEFSSEFEFTPDSFGFHQPWKFFRKGKDLKINLEKLFFEKNKKRIIFINHEESLTGAPRLLKDIINYEFSIEEFDIFYLSLSLNDDIWDLPNRIVYNNLEGTDIEKVGYLNLVFNPDMVFGNTFLSMGITSLFDCKKIIFIHEYRGFIPSLINDEYKVLENFDKIFVACENTMKLLGERNISSELIPYYLNTNLINKLKFEITNREYIVGIGYAQLRKGLDRFIEIATQLPDENFLWVGSTENLKFSDEYIEFEGDNFLLPSFEFGQKINRVKKRIQIPGNIKFVGLVQNDKILEEILPKTKCLLMLSTDDPFPLVVIEAKILNTNVVNLKESGDSYKVCDSNDLVLNTYDPLEIVTYLKKLKPNKFKINKSIQKVFNDNIVPFRKKYSNFLRPDGFKG